MFFGVGHETRMSAPNIWLLHNTATLVEDLVTKETPHHQSQFLHQRNSSSPKPVSAGKRFAYTHNSKVLKLAMFKGFAPTQNLARLLHVAVNSAQ